MDEKKPHTQNREAGVSRGIFWGTIALAGITLLISAYFFIALLRETRTFVIYTGMALFLSGVVTMVVSLVLTIRSRQEHGVKLTFFVLFILGMTAIGLFQGRALSASLSVFLISVITVRWLFPIQARRKYAAIIAAGMILMWAIEWINPPWRIHVQAASAGPIGAAVFAIILVVLAFLQTRKVIATRFLSLSLRFKLLTSIVGVTGLALLVYGLIFLYRTQQSQTFWSTKLQNTVQQQSQQQILDSARLEANTADQSLSQVTLAVQQLADYQAGLFASQSLLGQGGYWDGNSKLERLSGGQYGNAATDLATIFIPNLVSLSPSIVADLNTSMYLDFSAPKILEENPNIVAVYYDSADNYTVYYPNINLADLVPPDFDPSAQSFYTVATPKNDPEHKPVWTVPYQDPAGTGLIVTNSIPVYDQNKRFRGVMSADVQLSKISEQISTVKLGETGFAFMIDPSGHIIAMPDAGYNLFGISPELVPVSESPKTTILGLGSADFQNITQKMVNGEQGLATATIQDTPYYIAYYPLPTIGYSIGLIAPTSELDAAYLTAREQIVQETRVTTSLSILTLLVVLLAAGAVSLLLGRFLSTPLTRLTETATQVAKGNLNVKAEVLTNDEIGILASTFNTMTSRLQDILGSLEQRVADRTRNLELAAEVGRSVSQVRSLDVMLKDAAEIIRARFDLYYVQVYLTDPSRTNLILQAGTGAVGAELINRRHQLPLNTSSINGRAAIEQRSVIVLDTTLSPSFRMNPLLPDTRSEMAVPLLIGERVVGVLDIQSHQAGALSQEILPAFEALAGQLAIAIQNAELLDEAEQARAEVESQARRLVRTGWDEYLDAIHQPEQTGFVFEKNQIKLVEDADPLPASENLNALKAPISVTGETLGTLVVEMEKDTKTSLTRELVNIVARQVAQQIESLRLLENAERFRLDAEQAARRLTREGWKDYKQSKSNEGMSYIYDLKEVRPYQNNGNKPSGGLSTTLPLKVREEAVGKLSMMGIDPGDKDSLDLANAVAERLGAHIESLRLLEETETSRNELQQGEARLRTLVENAPEAIIVVDLATGLFTEPNENATKLYGLSREELLKVGPAQMSPPTQPDGRDSTEKAMEKIGEAMQGGTPVFEWIHRNSQGQDIPCEIRLVRLPGEHPLVRASVTDITERKKAQDTIARRATELQTVATVSTTASTVLDPDELLQAVVDLTKERFDLYHAHIYLADESWKTLLLASGSGEVGRQMVATGHAIQMNADKSLVARAARERIAIIVNDVRLDADFLPNPLLPDTHAEMAVPMIVGDQVIGVFDVQSDKPAQFIEEDINIYTTLAAQVAIALQNARLYVEQAATVTQLRELDRLKSSFLANMSHELRTPLNSILGFADVMLEELDGPLTENMSNDLSLIHKNGQHLLHLINDVLDMAKIDSGKMNLNIEQFNLQETIEEVVSITSPLASEKNLALLIESDSDHEVEINADKIRVRQVLINLINNAMKFTEKGSITIRVAREESNVLLSVKDTGIGIPVDLLESVFQEFTQVDTSTTRKVGGTGLGLPISRRLIEMHSGRLWAESTGIEGEGSTFYIFLPIESKVKV